MINYSRSVLVAGLWGALSGCTAGDRHASPDSTDGKERTSTGAEPYHGVIQYRATDAKPAILDPEFVEADESVIAAGIPLSASW